MSVQRNFRVSRIFTTGAVLLLALMPVVIMCRIASAQEANQAPSDTIDEIIVYGEKSLLALRRMAYRAEENFYDLFNSLNSDDENDVHCHKEAPTGSHIRRRICRANFEKKLTAEATSQWLVARRGGMGQTYHTPTARIRHKKKLMIEEMEVLISVHPELLEALSGFSDATQVFESEKQRRCEGRIFFCRI